MFQVRSAGSDPQDVATLVAIFDSTIPALAASGNEGQWGTQAFSETEGFLEETRKDVEKSEKFRLTREGDRVRTFIAQRHDAADDASSPDGLYRCKSPHGGSYLPAGAMTIRDSHFPEHLYTQDAIKPHLLEATQNMAQGFVFIDCLISDFRLPEEKRRGAGAALVEAAKDYARERKMRSVFVDCWTGGDAKLVPYYEKRGFKGIENMAINRKDGTIWPGLFMRFDLVDVE